MKVAVVGATGLVGSVMLKVLEEHNFPVTELVPVASERSIGKEVMYKGKGYKVVGMQAAIDAKPAVAIFSAGGATSKEWAPKFAEAGITVIDNSSAWRMNVDVPLVVPEVNAHVLTKDHKIIANPNCSTIQMVVALQPLHAKYGIDRLVISTYQSVTGTGVKGVEQLSGEREGKDANKVYPHPIDLNCLPHGGDFDETGYTSEEAKLVNETRKIMNAPDMRITATVVRVPVYGGHSESLNVELKQDFNDAELKQLLADAPGITLQDDPANFEYPMPLYSEGKDDVFVGRVRRDLSNPNSLNMWVVADNLRKGAATNAVQIAEYLLSKGLLA